MLNQCQFIGNLGAAPEVRTTQSGSKVVNLRLAVNRRWRDKSTGERRESTEWVPIVIFAEGLAKVAEQYLRKGSKIYVSGEFTTRRWTDQSGQDRYTTEIVLRPYSGELTLLDGKQGDSDSKYDAGDNGGYSPQGSDGGYSNTNSYDDMDSEIPF